MKTQFIFTSVCSLTDLIPFVVGMSKFKQIPEKFHPFIIFLGIGSIVDIASRILIIVHQNEIANNVAKCYLIYEGLQLTYLLYIWGAIEKRKTMYSIIALLSGIWLIDNTFFYSNTSLNSIYRIIYSSTIALLAINLFHREYFDTAKQALKDPLTIISGTLILSYTYRAVFESTYLFKLNFSNNFYFNIFMLFIILNVVSNCSFTYAIYRMNLKKRLTSLY